MDEDKFLTQDVYAIAEHMRQTKEAVLNKTTGLYSGSLIIGRTTQWIDLEGGLLDENPRLTITAVYSHRLRAVREAVWTNPMLTSEPSPCQQVSDLYCLLHNVPLIEKEAEFSYLDRFFKHKVLRCPVCGFVYVSEELARGRMKEVEQSLENK